MNKYRVFILETDGQSEWEDCYIVKSESSNLSTKEALEAIGINSFGYWPKITGIVPV